MRKHKEAVFVRIGSVSLNLPRAFFGYRNPVLAKNYCGLNKDAVCFSWKVCSSNNLAKKVYFGSIISFLTEFFLVGVIFL